MEINSYENSVTKENFQYNISYLKGFKEKLKGVEKSFWLKFRLTTMYDAYTVYFEYNLFEKFIFNN